MYTNRKSATEENSSTNWRKAGSCLVKGGQVAEPKLTTSGRSALAKSRRWHSAPSAVFSEAQLLPASGLDTCTTLELGASSPNLT
ncbi:rCG65856 [Rattus norvegicus]|uniref:RCG65856 n=1 Tax=Rattus norvegicus TaxID=10116 RepID=A6JEC4_RAT|nr:rCG65856 [Rattus norvegicus]